MSTDYKHVQDYIRRLLDGRDREELERRLQPKHGNPSPTVPGASVIDPAVIARRRSLVGASPESREALLTAQTQAQMDCYRHNIENFIGTVQVPVGLAGPLRVNGLFAQGDYYVPLATTEAALVASYSRGAQLLSEAGGCTALLLSEGLLRSPAFIFNDLREVGAFVAWVVAQDQEFKRVGEATTRYGKLNDIGVAVEGNHVYLNFQFLTGEASGQNIVTIATEAICRFILEHSPVKARYHFVEANFSGDKKASAHAYLTVRGKRVTAEVRIPGALIAQRLHTTPEEMVNFWRVSALGGVLSGTIGVQGEYANGLAALYLACGQDVACVAESAMGVTRLEALPDNELYAAVTLPNIMVGTVGGGTGLPSQRACLDILGLKGPEKARELAEVCAGLLLGGELSLIGALSAGQFTGAHQRLARGKRPPRGQTKAPED